MTDDKFGDFANVAILGTAKAIIPGTSLFHDVFRVITGDNDAKFRDVLLQETLDHVYRVEADVKKLREELEAQGKQIDELDSIARSQLIVSFVQDISQTASLTKRDDLIKATAAQFDPRLGSFSMRQYWLGRLRVLSEPALEVLKLHKEGALQLGDNVDFYMTGPSGIMWTRQEIAWESAGCTKSTVGFAAIAVYRSARVELEGPEPPLIFRDVHATKALQNKTKLTASGQEILKLIGVQSAL
jgi:hypothetical protein